LEVWIPTGIYPAHDAGHGQGKPVVGLGQGGHWYFGQLGLALGRPNGATGDSRAMNPVDPNHPLFSVPYPVDIPQDQGFELSDSMVVRTANAAWATQAN